MADWLGGTVIGPGSLALSSGIPAPPGEAPPDAIYGLQDYDWLPVLPLTGGLIFGGGGTIYSEGVARPLEIRADQHLAAAVRLHESGNRIWQCGTFGDGRFTIHDESAGQWRVLIDTAGTFSVSGQVSGNATLTGNLVYAQYIHSYGDSNVATNMTASGNVTATNQIVSGNWASIHGAQLGQLWGDGWFGTGSSFRAGNVNSANNVSAPGNFWAGGVAMWNDGASRLYTGEFRGAHLHSGGVCNIGRNLNCPTIHCANLWIGGVHLSNNGGWLRVNNGGGWIMGHEFNAVGRITVNSTSTGFIATDMGGENSGNTGGGWYVSWTYDTGIWRAYIGFNSMGWASIDGAWSDQRRKTAIRRSKFDCLAALEQLPLAQYRWKPLDPCPLDTSRYWAEQRVPPDRAAMRVNEPRGNARLDCDLIPVGFVAQDLYKVCPELVVKGDDGEGDSNWRNRFIWGIDEATMLATLTGAIQQLADRLDALET